MFFCSITESMGVLRLTGGLPETTKKAVEKGKAVRHNN